MTTDKDKWNTTPEPLDAEAEAMLDGLFAQARVRADASDEAMIALMTRIAGDAEAVADERDAQAAQERAARMAVPRSRHPLIEAMIRAVGGWRSVGGMGLAAVTGLALGLSSPTTVSALTSGAWDVQDTASDEITYTLDDMVPSFYDLALEG
ncbi:hypothetical protein [Celeribacter sp.]|uniref:hypothetical protein n=1 Tax=Celeribacter sp. TaxID=1890673 RepID=UPI003A9230C2